MLASGGWPHVGRARQVVPLTTHASQGLKWLVTENTPRVTSAIRTVAAGGSSRAIFVTS